MLMPKNLDLLQNIEFTITMVYRDQPTLPDYDVDDALAALVDDYRRDAGRPLREHRFRGFAEDVYAALKPICDMRVESEATEGDTASGKALNTRQELVTALGTIRKSVQRHGKSGGRQAYLQFIDSMMP